MSQDIRSYFLPRGSGGVKKQPDNARPKKKTHKRIRIVDSSSEDEEQHAATKKSKHQPPKTVNVADVFSKDKVKRTSSKATASVKDGATTGSAAFEDVHSDDDFEETLRQLHEVESSYEKQSMAAQESVKQDSQAVNSSAKSGLKHKGDTTKANNKAPENPSKKVKEGDNTKKEGKKVNDRNEVKSSQVTPTKSPATVCVDTSPSSDPAEKKRQHAMSYIKYLQREGPKNLGSKVIPIGKPGCLTGLTFVITGVLDSLEREQASSLIQQYGGKVTATLSKKTSYLIRGEDPGPSKIEKATTLGTPMLDEDGLLNLIVRQSESCEDNKTHNTSPKKAAKHKIKESNVTEKSSKSSPATVKKKTCVDSTSSKPEGFNSQTRQTVDNTLHTVKGSPLSDKGKEIVKGAKAETLLWVDKYRPTSSKQIIGQQGDKSVLKKLTMWLQNWFKSHSGDKKLAKPSPWAKNDDGSYFKAVLLSGPPGVGKTTMAHIVSKELGFDVVEFNASNTRSKKLLRDEVSELLSSKSLFGYFHNSQGTQSSMKHVLVMDEVDGMAGNEDRGGVQELIQLIKGSRVPIICMCNDRSHPKIRSLVNYCFDLRVNRPRIEQIQGAMMSVCFKEGLKISREALAEIICGANQDMRQILHHLSVWSTNNKNLSVQNMKEESQRAAKDVKLGPWDVLKKVFSASEHKTMSINDKSDLFFHDYSLSPLFVQENYLSVVPVAAKGNKVKLLDLVAQAADSISMGDIVDKNIRSRNAWSLLPVQAMYSSVIPGDIMEGFLNSQITFPSWLGKNSRYNKFDRLLQELHVHMRLNTSGNKEAINLDYLPHIRDAIVDPLIIRGSEGVEESLGVLKQYSLLREDLESILELTLWPNQKDPMSKVDSKVKAALTRTYNKEGVVTPYSVFKKHLAAASQESAFGEEDEEASGEEDDNIAADAMIKTKKRTASKAQDVAGSSAPKRGRGRGKR